MKAKHILLINTLPVILFMVARMCVAEDLPSCAAIGDSDKTRLVTYVKKKYNLPDTALVDVKAQAFVQGTCYRQLRFTAGAGPRPFHVDLFVSPDLRFLSRDVLDSNGDPAEQARQHTRAIAAALNKPGAASVGSADAPVTLVLFSDFECPFCSQMATGLRRDILPEAGDNVRLVFRNFPLPMHPWARLAADGAACARAQDEGYFWPIHDYLFDHQPDLTPDNVESKISERAAELDGFDPARFRSCIDARESAPSIEEDLALGNEMKVSATPTLFINGQKVTGYRAEQIRTMIMEGSGGKAATN